MDTNADQFLRKAKKIVAIEQNLTEDHVYIVWFAKTLQNWKALLSTDIPGDGVYYELTYDGNKQQTYVDFYKKQSNTVITDEWFESV